MRFTLSLHLLQFLIFFSIVRIESTLLLSQVVIRHGDKTMDLEYTFPNLDHEKISFGPYGPGELNLKGKKKMFQVGKALRKQYNTFLGEDYQNDLIEALSSEYKRSMMSMQVILAGLFPPIYLLESGLNWRPIPFNYIPFSKDKMIAVNRACPKIFNVKTRLDNTTLKYYKYLEKHSGMKVANSFNVNIIYHIITSYIEYGSDIPNWIEPLWPETLEDLALQMWDDIIQQHLQDAGYLLKKIHDDTRNKIERNYKPKFMVYSAHDVNIVFLLGALQNYNRRVINYGAYLVFELHEINSEFYIRILLEIYNYDDLEVIVIPGCSEFCIFDVFVNLTRMFLPTGNWCK